MRGGEERVRGEGGMGEGGKEEWVRGKGGTGEGERRNG